MRKEERSGRNKNPVLITYCSAISYPKTQCHITSTVLLAHESVDVQFGHCSEETVYLYLHMVFARLTWGWRSQGTLLPCLKIVLAAGCRALEFLLQMLPLSSRIAWFLPYTVAQELPLLRSIILTALLLPHSVPLGQPRLQGEGKEMPPSWWVEQHVQTGMGRTTGDHLCKQSVISPTTGNHCNVKEIKRKN